MPFHSLPKRQDEGKAPVNRIIRQSSHEETTLGAFPAAVLVCHDMGQSILPALPSSELLKEPLKPLPEIHCMPLPLEDVGSAMTNLINLSFGEMHVLQDAEITVCLWDDHELGDDLEFHIVLHAKRHWKHIGPPVSCVDWGRWRFCLEEAHH